MASTKQAKTEEVNEESTAGTQEVNLTQIEADLRARIAQKLNARTQNQEAARERGNENDPVLVKRDTSMKKNTAFVKKLKTMSEAQREALMKDFNTLNLSK